MSKDNESLDDLDTPETEGDDLELDDLYEDDESDSDNSDEDDGKEIDWKARAKKAEAKIVADKLAKKGAPDAKKTEAGDVESITRRVIQEENFYKENPSLKDRKKEIDQYVSKGLTLDEAKVLVTREETKRGANQTRSNSQRVAGSPKPTQSRYTTADLESMSQKEYNSVMERREKGEVEIVE